MGIVDDLAVDDVVVGATGPAAAGEGRAKAGPRGPEQPPGDEARGRAAQQRAGGWQQEQQAEDVADEARDQQQQAAEQDEETVGDLAGRDAAGLGRLDEVPVGPAAFPAEQRRTQNRRPQQEQDRHDGTELLADLDDHVQLDDRHEHQEKQQQH